MKNQRGITLIELIIVIAIIGIIGAVGISRFSSMQRYARERADEAIASEIGRATKVYLASRDYDTPEDGDLDIGDLKDSGLIGDIELQSEKYSGQIEISIETNVVSVILNGKKAYRLD